ncbi:RAS guanyl-releasing protein 4 [Dissostichus eleginoides]|uniref:RAS guanyl-releasing protein 4 n=1 Tax=Dissostichus eleginoides TaxID=100907 RepID=A0AAD9CKK2_DISEL|nr:RAS guanyl-releasing protein 4 [Dissostichus eleginoides]
METRSRLNNLRVVNLPEGAEDPDTCSFLEGWIPEALDLGPLRCPIVMERAHRVGPRRDSDTPPRTLIMRFLNYKDKVTVIKAAKAKKDIL